jgi:hypothetical protein
VFKGQQITADRPLIVEIFIDFLVVEHELKRIELMLPLHQTIGQIYSISKKSMQLRSATWNILRLFANWCQIVETSMEQIVVFNYQVSTFEPPFHKKVISLI